MATSAVKKVNQKLLRENERKWGLPLMRVGWSIVPATILWNQKELGLDAIDVNIVVQLISHWWAKDRLPFPTKALLASRIGVHRSTIQRRIRRMEQRGLIHRIKREEKARGQTSNAYDLDGLIAKGTELAKKALKEREEKEKRGMGRGAGHLRVVKPD